MIMADVLKILFAVLGLLATLISYWLLFEACVPRFVARAAQAYERQPLRVVLWGLAVTGPALLLGVALANAGNGAIQLLGVVMLLLLLGIALLGSTGFVRLVGQRLSAPGDEWQPWRRVLRGGSIVALTFVLPLLGWFMVLPAVLVSGVGAVWLARQPASRPVPAPQSVPAETVTT